MQVWFHLSATGFLSNRVFPTPGIGTKAGWHYTYPVHEVHLLPTYNLFQRVCQGLSVSPEGTHCPHDPPIIHR